MNSPFSKNAQIITEHGDYCVLSYEMLDVSSILATVSAKEAGAIATFIGQTRDNFQGMIFICQYVFAEITFQARWSRIWNIQ